MTYDFEPFFTHTVGFERLFNRLNNIHEDIARTKQTYPPYNIRRHDDETFDIEIAVAGFKEEELDVEHKDNTLTVEGKKNEAKTEDYIHRGIAARGFRRVWHLEDFTKVTDANLEDGLLSIRLEKIIPEELRPKKIKINNSIEQEPGGGSAELLNEEASAS